MLAEWRNRFPDHPALPDGPLPSPAAVLVRLSLEDGGQALAGVEEDRIDGSGQVQDGTSASTQGCFAPHGCETRGCLASPAYTTRGCLSRIWRPVRRFAAAALKQT